MANTFWVHRTASTHGGNLNSFSVSVESIVGFDVIAVVSTFSNRPFHAGWELRGEIIGIGGNNNNRLSVLKRTADSTSTTYNTPSSSWGAGAVWLSSLTNTVDVEVLDESLHNGVLDFDVPDKPADASVLWAMVMPGSIFSNPSPPWQTDPDDLIQYSLPATRAGGDNVRQAVFLDRGNGTAIGRSFTSPLETPANVGLVMAKITPTGDGLQPPWGLDSATLGGYPRPNGIESSRIGRELPFRFSLSDVGFRFDDDILGGYPFVHYVERIPPPPPPPPLAEIADINLNVLGRYVGSERDVVVTLVLQNVLDGDGINIQLYRNGTMYYEFDATLQAGAETFSHTIPEAVFVGLPVGSYVVRVKLCRDDEIINEVGTDYYVVPAPTVTFDNLQPTEIQLPISVPLTITSSWRMTGEGINRIQGSATIGGTLHSTAIDLNSQTFNANFANVTSLAMGEHSISINLSITSDRYGTATAFATNANALTVFAPIPEPEIANVTLSGVGRYVGIAVPVTVSVGLDNIREGDSITIRLRQGNSVFYEHNGNLSANVTSYSRTIAASVFSELVVGSYTVQVVIVRDYAIRDEALVTYRIVDLPTVQLLYVSPNTIQLPMSHAEDIDVTFQIVGAGVDSAVGTVTLDDTGFSSAVNTTNTQFTATLSNVDELTPRGYSVLADITVISNNYGTIMLSEQFSNAFRALAEVVPIKRNHRSNTLYIYDGFTLVHILRNYISLKWVRRYNRTGEFTLHLTNTPENVALAQEGFIIAKDNDDEAAFIEDVTIGEHIEVKGAFISKMLSFRVVNFVNENLVNLQTTADNLIRANFINTSPERIIPGFRIADYTISSQHVLARIDNGTIEHWLEQQDIGFKVTFLPQEQAFEFSLYDGRRSTATFCENFRNVTDEQFFHQTGQSRNVVIVEGQPLESAYEGGEPIRNIITVGNASGLARREAYTRSGRFPMVDFGHQFLRNNEPVKSLDVKIVDPYVPFEYRQDYDIGDIVTIISESKNVSVTENIMEVTEFYDKTGFHIYGIFGKVPRNLLMELRDNNNRVDELWNNPEHPPLDLELIKDLVIPPLLDEIFDLIEFPPLPDWLYPWESFRELLEVTTNEVLNVRLRPEVIELLEELLPIMGGGHGGEHIILDRMPTQAEINLMPVNAEVLVYDPSNPFIPSS